MGKNKISFKKQPKTTGLASISSPLQDVDIKLDGEIFGTILSPNWRRNNWSVLICVYKNDINEDGNPNCPFKNIVFKKTFETEIDARNFIKNNIDAILEKYKLYFMNS